MCPTSFVSKDQRPKHPAPDAGDEPEAGYEVERLILAGKNMGFSLDELRDITVAELIVLADIRHADMASATKKADKPKRRKATQDDIDRFLR